MTLIGPEGRKQLKQAGRFAGAGISLAASIVVGYFVGRWADGKLGTAYLAYVGLLLGIVAGFRDLYKLAKPTKTPDDSNPTPPPNE